MVFVWLHKFAIARRATDGTILFPNALQYVIRVAVTGYVPRQMYANAFQGTSWTQKRGAYFILSNVFERIRIIQLNTI